MKKKQATKSSAKNKSSLVEIPNLQSFLRAGVQFGHGKKRWNPKMKKYIYAEKKDIHIIDLRKTVLLLEKALKFLSKSARKGPLLFVGTKRQAAGIVRDEAVRAGAYFVINRWPGGLLTNFKVIKKSLKKLRKLEERFEEGIEGRTKYEVSKLKVDWARLNRMYGGIKTMKRYPSALVVVDPRYEIGAVVEANKLDIPVVAITDTDCNPDIVDYIVPGNDDAIGSIELFMKLFADSILLGNGGEGVQHSFKDYSSIKVKFLRAKTSADKTDEQQHDIENIETKSKKKKSKFRIKKKSKEEKKPIKDKKTKSKKKKTKPKGKKNNKNKSETKASENKKSQKKEQISSRVKGVLDSAGVSVKEAKKMSKKELLEIKGLGPKSVKEIL